MNDYPISHYLNKNKSDKCYGHSYQLVYDKCFGAYNRDIELDILEIGIERGGMSGVRMAKYIQYEHWDDLQVFHRLLEKDFNMEYIGERNVFCTRK